MKTVDTTHTFSRRNIVLASVSVAVTALILAAFAVAGCGSSSGSSDSTQPGSPVGQITRPAPGTVKIVDAKQDQEMNRDKVKTIPIWLDISSAQISKEGDNLKFSIDMGGKLPDTIGQGQPAQAEVAYLLDVDKDGTPDWGIFADFDKNGWTPGIYNMKTKTRLTGAQYPGTFTRDAATLNLVVNPSAFGSPEGFRWLAYLDSIVFPTADDPEHVTDQIVSNVKPDSSDGWPEYP